MLVSGLITLTKSVRLLIILSDYSLDILNSYKDNKSSIIFLCLGASFHI
nr:MAG TPA: hypothetical protein [Crassvirales sp.]